MDFEDECETSFFSEREKDGGCVITRKKNKVRSPTKKMRCKEKEGGLCGHTYLN